MAEQRFKSALWEDPNTRERVRARERTADGSRDIFIDPSDEDNWNALLEEYSLEDIDKATELDVERYRERRHQREQEERENEERRYQEMLFAEKMLAFEIPEVKNLKDKKIKRRIRKSKTMLEVAAYSAAAIVAYDMQETSDA